MSDTLREVIQRVKAGSRDESDIQILTAAFQSGELVLANASGAVSIGEDVVGSQIVTGSSNVTGDHNTVVHVYGGDAQTIQAILRSRDSEQLESVTSINELLVQEVRSHCCEKIQDFYSRIRLLNLRQVEVDQLYVEVHILEQPISKVYAKIPDLLHECNLRNDFDRFGLGQRSEKRLSGLKVARDNSRLVVLGKPGAGKSTFLRYLAIACCKGNFSPKYAPTVPWLFWFKWYRVIQNQQLTEVGKLSLWVVSLAHHLLSKQAIPVLIELRSIQDASQFRLLDVLQQEFQLDNQQQTQDILDTGRVLLLMDGLDEVADQSRRTVQNQIAEFSRNYYRKTQIILTCRTQTVEYLLPNFEYVEVAEFNLEQVEIFARNWFTTQAGKPEQGTDLATQFMTALRSPEHRRTAELAVTPVLLSLTCWVFQDSGGVPEKRIELYQRGVDLLLEQWDTERGIERTVGGQQYQSLNTTQKQALLSYVAIRKFEQNQFALFEQQEIQRYIAGYFQTLNQEITDQESRDVLKAVEAQHGLIVERASQIYSFSHLTFQEFFAAKWLCQPANQQHLTRYLTDTRGRELIRFALEMPFYADDVVYSLNQSINELLAADELLQQFLTWLYQKACSVNSSYKPAAVRAFYYALDRTYNFSHDLTHDLTGVLDTNLAHDIARARDRDLNRDRDRDLFCARDLALDRALIRAYTLAHDLDHFDLDDTLVHEFTSVLDLCCARARVFDPKLQDALQALAQRFPDPQKDWGCFQGWCKTEKPAWIAQFRTMLIRHRNIKHEWQFSKEQAVLLQQYYDTNKQLIDWLRGSSEVSSRVQQEIEEMLLLPISEIEKPKLKGYERQRGLQNLQR